MLLCDGESLDCDVKWMETSQSLINKRTTSYGNVFTADGVKVEQTVKVDSASNGTRSDFKIDTGTTEGV